jgi:rhodanese-related sulfurtransferase
MPVPLVAGGFAGTGPVRFMAAPAGGAMRRRITAVMVAAAIVLGACSSGDRSASPEPVADDATAAATETPGTETAGIRTVGPEGFAAALSSPAERVVIDVRTDEEFAAGHLDRAELIDFYATDFGDRLALLDRSVPYAIYCRSGNRSGQTAAIMRDLGFTDVVELGGGIVAWQAEGRAVTTD